eukprot:745951-Prorocentrum_minimum.AAC.1
MKSYYHQGYKQEGANRPSASVNSPAVNANIRQLGSQLKARVVATPRAGPKSKNNTNLPSYMVLFFLCGSLRGGSVGPHRPLDFFGGAGHERRRRACGRRVDPVRRPRVTPAPAAAVVAVAVAIVAVAVAIVAVSAAVVAVVAVTLRDHDDVILLADRPAGWGFRRWGSNA